MTMHHRRTWRHPGPPELVAVALLVLTAALVTQWWRAVSHPVWEETAGRVVRGEIEVIREHSRPEERRVRLDYAYNVHGVEYTGEYKGFWPAIDSPNALPPDSLERLTEPGHPLVVLYHGGNPAKSRLHYAGTARRVWYGVLALAAGLMALFYCLSVYPVWRGGPLTRSRAHP
ncbi:MAG: DUF3592 domain-containing protein [Candidatus Hydrogenedentes bacterium]|nr:DUF3592 domain-containing protein [Candidatus Hydrogenedentota bacterium]